LTKADNLGYTISRTLTIEYRKGVRHYVRVPIYSANAEVLKPPSMFDFNQNSLFWLATSLLYTF